jgi:hypothetical protein
MRVVAAIRQLRLASESGPEHDRFRWRLAGDAIGRQSSTKRMEEEAWLSPVLLMTSRRSVPA